MQHTTTAKNIKASTEFIQTDEQRKVTSSVWFQRLQCQGLGIVRSKEKKNKIKRYKKKENKEKKVKKNIKLVK